MRITCLVAALAIGLSSTSLFAQDKTGSISGKILFAGDVPAPKILVEKGNPAVKDAQVCAAQNVLSEEIVIDPATKGLKNVFIYMRKAPAKYKLGDPEVPVLKLDQKGCTFYPHALIVQSNQKVQVVSSDNCVHNFRTNPLRNSAVNFLIGANDQVGSNVTFNGAEILPMKVGCDIHTWMTGWWLVVDHPFAAITDEKGEFKIENVPAGEHEFRIWQERVGYVEKSVMIKVKAGENTELKTIEVPASKFEE